MNNEEKLDFIKSISGFSGKGCPSGERDAIQAVKELRKRYDAEYQRNRDKMLNNGGEVIFIRLEIKKVEEELRGFKNSYFLLKKKLEKLEKLKDL